MRPLLHLLILIKVGNKYTTYQVARFCRFFLILFSPWTNDTKNNHIKVIRSFLPTVEHFFKKKSCPAMYCNCKTCNKCCHDFIVRSIFTMKISHFLKCTDKTSHGKKTVFFLQTWYLIYYTFVVLWIWIMLIRIQLRHQAYADSHPNPYLNTSLILPYVKAFTAHFLVLRHQHMFITFSLLFWWQLSFYSKY